VWVDARCTAVDFYRSCGAEVIGPSYMDELTGLVDRRIVIDLRPDGRLRHQPDPVADDDHRT